MSRELDRVLVVIPACNEERLLGASLAALQRAIDTLRRARPAVTVTSTLVLDRCEDGSARIARRHENLQLVETDAGSAGYARAAGVRAALQECAGLDQTRVWIANSDADSQVPDCWLIEQVTAAESAVDVLVGAVRPNPADLDPAILSAWWARHTMRDGHRHVFGANLGIRASGYRALGGFPHIATGEDVALVAAARAQGLQVRSLARCPVLTSGRARGRAIGGFATYLNALAIE